MVQRATRFNSSKLSGPFNMFILVVCYLPLQFPLPLPVLGPFPLGPVPSFFGILFSLFYFYQLFLICLY
jgi:hypothetical protein